LWIGIVVTYLVINLILIKRRRTAFSEDVQFEEMGQPNEFESAKRLVEKWTSNNSSSGRCPLA